jgi:hypothetical protein
VFVTCAKVYEEWEATRSKDARITLAGIYVDDLWFVLGRSGRLPDSSAEIPRDKPNHEYRGIHHFFLPGEVRIDEIAGDESI